MPRANANGIELEYDTFGDPSEPALLLVMGYTGQMTAWEEGFCKLLVDHGFHVIRFDNRDCGLSTKLDGVDANLMPYLEAFMAGQPAPDEPVPYTLSTMAADAIGLLDHLGIARAHIVGVSMGGMIVQTMAIEHPDRVATMASIMSSTGELDVGQPTPEAMMALLTPPPTDREGYVARIKEAYAVFASKRYYDPEKAGERAAASFDRSFYPEGGTRQLSGVLASGDRAEALAHLDLPTLVIHGLDDTLIDPSGAQRTAELIPGSKLLLVKDMGHDLPEPLWPFITGAIAANARADDMAGPLAGYRIIEVAGIGPGPFCAMMLADMGADVIRVDRAQNVRQPIPDGPSFDVLNRGRRSVAIDMKHPDGVEAFLRLVEVADGLIEGFRPGVMERLGAGPDVCLARNPKLVFGRMTGWGQEGPYAAWAGHDINYIALAGALAHFGRRGESPTPPLNTVGDFGGGGMLLAFGLVCGLLEAQRSGEGQVIDAAMVDGAAVLMTMFHAFRAIGMFDEEHRGTNLLDTGAHFYDVYRCADGRFISVGSIEPQFYAELLRLTGLQDDPEFAQQLDTALWPVLKGRLEAIFHRKTRDEWCALMEHTDVCFAPVLTMSEAVAHPHNQARATFVDVAGVIQPAPAPRFSRTTVEVSRPPAHAGQHTSEVLADWGLDGATIEKLLEAGAVR